MTSVLINPNPLYQCRLCLKQTSYKVINVFAGDFPKMLESLTTIKVRESDGLPKYCCLRCAQDLKNALIIRKRFVRSHKYLIENLNKKQSKTHDEVQIVSITKIKKELENKTPTVKQAVKSTNSLNTPVLTKIKVNSGDLKETTPKPTELIVTKIEVTEPKLERVERPTITLDKKITRIKKENPVYKCSTCDKIFGFKCAFRKHLAYHAATVKKKKCELCGITIRADNYKKHLAVHTGGPVICNICGVTCKNFESLRGHTYYQHRSNKDSYICEECGKHFRIKYKFELHKMKEHTGVRNFKCETCGKAFFTRGNLNSHVNRTHKKLRPHICEYCGTGYSSRYALKTHKRQHTNEKPYVCDICDEGFRQKVSLRAHLKSKHNIEESKDVVCEVCNKGFATTYALSIHARLHMAQKCEVCSESFAEPEYLQNHIKLVHNVKKVEEELEDADLNESFIQPFTPL